MGPGRKRVMTLSAHDDYHSPSTVEAKWIGSSYNPKADTNRPVLVYDAKHGTK